MSARALALAAALAGGPAFAQSPSGLLTRLPEIGRAIRGCWRVPDTFREFERVEATVTFSLKVDGSLLGEPRVSYSGLSVPLGGPARDILGRSVVEAVRACTPVPLSAGLGSAVAGRVFTIRFVYTGPKGRGA